MHNQKDVSPVIVGLTLGGPGRCVKISSWQNATMQYFMDQHHGLWAEEKASISVRYIFQQKSFTVAYELKGGPAQIVEVQCHSKILNGPSTFIITITNGADIKRYRAALESGNFNILGLASPHD